MLHPIFDIIIFNNLIEVIFLIQSYHEAVKARKSEWYDATPLHYASFYGRLQICRVLLQHDAPVGSLDRTGKTPLHIASQNGRHEVARLLLEYYAHVNALEQALKIRHYIWLVSLVTCL